MAYLRLRSESPFENVVSLQHELDRFFGSGFAGALAPSGRGVFPAVDIFDRDQSIVVKAELPGLRREDVDLVVEDDKLTISGKRAIAYEGDRLRFHRREREQGQFRRVLRLPTKLDTESANASYANGVLTVTIPKAPEIKPRQVPVQVS